MCVIHKIYPSHAYISLLYSVRHRHPIPIHTSTYFSFDPFSDFHDNDEYVDDILVHEDILLQIVRFVCTNHGQSHCVVKRKYFINVDPSFITNNHLKHPLEHSVKKSKHIHTHTEKKRDRGKDTTTDTIFPHII